jgi:hypothetical protein
MSSTDPDGLYRGSSNTITQVYQLADDMTSTALSEWLVDVCGAGVSQESWLNDGECEGGSMSPIHTIPPYLAIPPIGPAVTFRFMWPPLPSMPHM